MHRVARAAEPALRCDELPFEEVGIGHALGQHDRAEFPGQVAGYFAGGLISRITAPRCSLSTSTA